MRTQYSNNTESTNLGDFYDHNLVIKVYGEIHENQALSVVPFVSILP